MNSKLSERIIESANDIVKELIDNDYVQKLLMTGDMNEQNLVIAHRAYKYNMDVLNVLGKFYEQALQQLDGEEEKAGIEQALQAMEEPFTKWLKEYEQIFGVVSKEILSAPVAKQVTEYGEHLTHVINDGKDVIRIPTAIMAAYVVLQTVYQYLVNNPKYKANPFAQMFTFSTIDDKLIIECKTMIDNRSASVTPELEQKLCMFYRKCVQVECDFHLGFYTGN